jgi:hypothetical protein
MVRKNIISAMGILTLATGSLDVTAFLRWAASLPAS